MRKLIWFTLGFGAACFICAYIAPLAFLALPMLFLAVAEIFFFREYPKVKRIAIMVLGISAGIFWFGRYQTSCLNPVYALDGQVRQAKIRCISYGEETDYGSRVKASTAVNGKE